MKQRIIGLEGIDGTGKGTQCALLAAGLRAAGHRCLEVSFPRYESFFGAELGRMLGGRTYPRADAVDPKSMALWYALDRRDFFNHLGTDWDCLVLNRYSLSNAVYQALRGEDPEALGEWAYRLEHHVLALPEPDLYFIFDLEEALSQENVQKKGPRSYTEGADVYEASPALQRNARQLYLALAARYRLPFDSVPPVLARVAMDIAVADLPRNGTGEADLYERRARAARALLRSLATGETALPLPPAQANAGGGVGFYAPPSPLAGKLKDFDL
jgi:dTMP kinase